MAVVLESLRYVQLCNPIDCSLPGLWNFAGKILEWVAISLSRGSSWPRNRTRISCISCMAGRFFTIVPPGKPLRFYSFPPKLMCILFFNWSIIDLQCCISSRGTKWWFNIYTHDEMITMISQLSCYCLKLLFSCSVVSDSLRPYGLQHTRLLCPSLSPRVNSNSCPLSHIYVCVRNWVILLEAGIKHDIVNQLYFNKILKKQTLRYRKILKSRDINDNIYLLLEVL